MPLILLLASTALAAAPVATTSPATSITSNSAQLNGLANPNGEAATGWFRHATVNPGSCDDSFGTRVPASGGTAVGAGTSNAPYSVSTSGLAPGTTYYFCAIVSNASGTAFGAMVSFTTPALTPTVVTSAATNLTSSDATFQGSANPNGSATTGYFRYASTSPGTCNNTFGLRVPATGGTAVGAGNSVVPYTEVVTGLLAGATYYYCAIATNSVSTGFGNVLSFTTLIAAPTVTTSAASFVTGTSATLSGNANPNGASSLGWFRYSSSNPGGCNDAFGTRLPVSGGTNLGGGSSPAGFSLSASGLNPGTTYYYCAISSNSVGTSFGSVLTFVTPAAPTVTTSAATLVATTTATLNGSAIPNGASATGWFRYDSVNPGTCNDSFGIVTTSTSLGAGATDVPYARAITGLLPGTTYYTCAISANSVGTSFGTLLIFTTAPTAPIVTTGSATVVSGTTATLYGQANPRGATTTGWLRYSTSSPGTCNDSFGTRAPGFGGTGLGSSNTSQPYSQSVNGLTPGTTYFYCALASNSVGLSVGSVLSFITPTPPVVVTNAATNLGGNSATLNGNANPGGAATLGYYRYATTNPVTCNDTFGTRAPLTAGTGTNLGAGYTGVNWQQNIASLTPGTTYYFCAIAGNAEGTSFGAVLSFLTPAAPTMVSSPVTLLTATSATLNGSGDPNGSATTAWYRWDSVNPVTCSDSFGVQTLGTSLGSGSTALAYSRAISGLLPGTNYFFCAIGLNSVDYGYGAVLSFTTPPTAPIVTTSSANAITGTTATLNGVGNPRGAAATGYFRYSTTSPGSCNDTFGTLAPATGGSALGSGNTSLAYNQPLTGLTPGTTYFYCAIATNSVGLGFGGVLSFATPNVPVVTSDSVTNLTGSTATLNSTGTPNGAATIGWVRTSTTNPGSCNDSFGTRTPVTAGTGTNLGSSGSPIPWQQNISGLTPGTTYYWCALASNLVGTGLGAVLTFTTPAIPTVVTVAPTGVTATAALLNATANPNGAATTGWFRYDVVNPVTCNDSFGTRAPATLGTALGGGNSAQPYSVNPGTLNPGTTYYFCALASNLVGTGFGAVLSFTTPPTAPLVVTSTASAVTSGSARLNGSTNPRGAAATAWFRYSTTSPGTCNDSFGIRAPASGGASLGSGNSYIAHFEDVIGLALATTYYYCAIASNSQGTSFGAVVSFTTAPAPPLVTTLAATGVTTSAAVMNATAIPNGAAATGWFRFSTTMPATCNDSFGTRVPASGGTALGAGTSAVPYSVNPTTLNAGVQYYYCAIASNSAGTSFGAVLNFTTVSTPPSLTTLAATSIGGTSATLNGSANPNGDSTLAWFRYSTTSPGSCTDSFGTRFPASGGSTLGSGTTAAPFSQALSGLTPGSTYYFCAIAQNSNGTSLGAVLSFATPNAPAVTTSAASPVNSFTATLNGSATPNGTAATGWFRYSAIDPGSCDGVFGTASASQALGTGGTPVTFAQALSGLSPGTQYWFCAISSNAVGTSFGALLSFTTPPTSPTVATLAATALTGTTAALNGSANPNGAASTGWFRYSTVNPGSCSDSFGTRSPAVSGGSALGAGTATLGFTQNATGLTPGTTYYFCPIASNSVGTSFGGVLSFITPAAPAVTTAATTAIATTQATLNGSANPNRDAATGWFRYSTTNPVTCDDSFGTRAPAVSGGSALGGGNLAVAFNQPITGLTSGTTYYVCALASNAVGLSVGTVSTFTTLNAPIVTTLATTAILTTSATLNGSANPNAGTATGWFRYSTVNPVTCNDTFGTRAPLTSGGTALGAGTAAVPYNRPITGLTSGTTYWVCAIANNPSGTSFGAPVSFSTAGPPVVTTAAATGLTVNSATLNGSANPNNATATGWFRYSTTNPGSCNDVFGIRTPASGGTALGAGSSAVVYTAALTGLASATTYYFCALASNASGTGLGTVQSFVTPAAPAVTTSAATAVTGTTASLNGSANPRADATTGWFRYSTVNPVTCNDTFGTRDPATGGTSLGAGSSAVPYSNALTGLAPGTTHYFCALASNSVGTSFGGVLSFTTPGQPAVTTVAASGLTANGATLNGSANPNLATANGWFRYSTTNPVTCDDAFGTRTPASGGTALGAGSAAVPFSQALTGLTGSTTYYYCAISSNSVGTGLGALLSFTTPTAPAVTTAAATLVTSTTATLGGSANPNNQSASGWFRYGTTNPGTCTDTVGARAPATGGAALGAGSAAVPYSQAITGLLPGTTYYFCAIASNAIGSGFGAVLSFTTLAAPVVVSVAATAITSSAATLNGTANPGGDATTGFFRYSTTSPGTCNNTFGTRVPATGGTALGAGTTAAPFSELPGGLASATTYFYCAIATNSVGTSFGAVLSFTTTAGPAVTSLAPSGVTATGATLNGSANPRMNATTGWFRYSTTNPGACDDTFGARAPASGGSTLGSGNADVPYSEVISGLTAGTTYFFCAIASNSVGTSFGSLLSFIAPAPPVMTTSAATLVTGSDALLNGTGVGNGAATTGWFRYSATNPGTCTDTFGTRSPASGGSALGATAVATSYSQGLTGLSQGTTYYFCAIGSSSEGTRMGAVLSFTTLQAPTVVTVAASAVTGTGATLNGTANPNGLTATGWLRYSSTDPVTCNDTFGTRAPATGGTALGAGTSAAPFSAVIGALTPATTYYFCAISSSSVGTSFGTVVGFNTPAVAPVVTTVAASGVGSTGGTLNGTAIAGGAATDGWFRYSSTNPGTCNDTFGTRTPGTGGTALGSGNSAAPFTAALTGLALGATTYYCAIASNSLGTAFGAVLSFTTATAPVLVTSAATNVLGTSATLNGTANANGNATTAWFRIGTTDPGTCNDTFGARTPVSGGTVIGMGSAPSAYSQPATALLPGTTYYFCAIGANAAGAAFGAVRTLRTPAAPTVMTSSASDVNLTLATFNGSANPNGADGTGWFRYATTSPGTCNDTFGTRTPPAALGAGTTDVGWSQVAMGLTPGATYYFCAIASNTVGTSFGAVLSFVINAPVPVVMTQAATLIDAKGGVLNGTANPNGTATNGWFRYSTTRPAACDDTFGTRVPAAGGMGLGAGTAAIPLAIALTDLKPNSTVHFCAIAANAGGAAFGEVLTFNTTALLPAAVTLEATADADGRPTLNGSGNPNGLSAIGTFRYGTENPGTCNLSFGMATEGIQLGAGTDVVPFKAPIGDLKAGATYFFCATVVTSAGTAQGEVLQFKLPGGGGGCGCATGGGSGAPLVAVALALLSWVGARRKVNGAASRVRSGGDVDSDLR